MHCIRGQSVHLALGGATCIQKGIHVQSTPAKVSVVDSSMTDYSAATGFSVRNGAGCHAVNAFVPRAFCLPLINSGTEVLRIFELLFHCAGSKDWIELRGYFCCRADRVQR
jgi:hypothetical protein